MWCSDCNRVSIKDTVTNLVQQRCEEPSCPLLRELRDGSSEGTPGSRHPIGVVPNNGEGDADKHEDMEVVVSGLSPSWQAHSCSIGRRRVGPSRSFSPHEWSTR